MRMPERAEGSASGMPLRRDLRVRTRVHLLALIMTSHHIGRIVIGCLTAGVVVALGLVVGPLAGAQEHVIAGAILLALASSWALLATLSVVSTEQPQRWAVMPAGFMALAGSSLLAFAPNGSVIEMLGWVWPPLLLGLIAMTVIRVNRDLHSRTRSWIVYPLFAGMVLLDGQPAEAFERLPSFPAFYNGFRRISALFPSLARLGVGRLVYHADFATLPAQARDMRRLNYSSPRAPARTFVALAALGPMDAKASAA